MNNTLPFVAATVHQRVDAPVEQSVLRLEAQHPERAGKIVLAAAPVRLRVAAHLDVIPGTPALTAPLGARDAQHAVQIAPLPRHARNGRER